MTLFANRSDAAHVAKRRGLVNFMTLRMPGGWKLVDMPGVSPAAEYAKGKDFVAWVESSYIDEGRTPGMKGVLVVSCFKDELPDDIPAELDVQPQTPSLWDGGKGDALKSTGSVIIGGRVRSEVESPTKLVWKLADEMPGSPRADVIAACIAAGVNEATAKTQYYRWNKERNA